jgi:hypothetical protein
MQTSKSEIPVEKSTGGFGLISHNWIFFISAPQDFDLLHQDVQQRTCHELEGSHIRTTLDSDRCSSPGPASG